MVGRMRSGVGRSALGIDGWPDGTALSSSLSPPWFHGYAPPLLVHELGFGLLPNSYVFKGTKEVTKEQILEQMCFFAGKKMPTTGVIAGTRDGLSSESISRFLLPASE